MSDNRCAYCDGPIPADRAGATYCRKLHRRKAQERRARAKRWAVVGLAAAPPVARCWSCDKLACSTEEAAKAAKRAVEIETGRVDEVRYYECPEGWWHWTRMDATLDGFRARVGNGAK